MQPSFPVYVVSKGRADSRITIRELQSIRVPFFVVVEAQEFEAYAAHVDRSRVLVLDPAYQRDYDTFDDLGATKSKGPGAARNFAWDHALSLGASWHWVMDDNIRHFYRLNKNTKIACSDGTPLRAMEDFVQRYANVAMAGPNYEMFQPRRQRAAPFTTNTRIYSCNLIRGDVPFRWRGRYNEDTDLSLRMMKAGWCTIQFNAFLQDKVRTQAVPGGNTADFYEKEGTLAKSKMLVDMHPDVSKLVWKFNRWHHLVDYSGYQRIGLVRREGVVIPAGVNEYGMRLRPVAEALAR